MELSVRRRSPVREIMTAVSVLAAVGCEDRNAPPPKQLVVAPAEANVCGDPTIADRLRALIIGQAERLRPADAGEIERIGGSAALSLGESRTAGRDAALNLTICRARVSFELPEGASDAFDGGRQLAAELRYAVQRSARGEWLVHQLLGAEPLVYRLAAVPLRTQPPVQPSPTPSAQAAAARPTPAPKPLRTARPRELPPERIVKAPPLPRRGLPEPALTNRGRPSFDCRLADARVERMICGDERLAAFDRVTASLYARTLARADRDTRAVLRETQARFIERRDDCRRAGCVADRYRDRLDQIDAIASR